MGKGGVVQTKSGANFRSFFAGAGDLRGSEPAGSARSAATPVSPAAALRIRDSAGLKYAYDSIRQGSSNLCSALSCGPVQLLYFDR